MPHTTRKLFLNAREVAEALGVSHHTVARWCRTGRLRAIKLGRLVRVRAADIERLAESKERDS
jgi:excisionase family DNA binding protein